MCEFSVKTSCIGEMKQNINVRLLSLTVNNNETSRLLYIFIENCVSSRLTVLSSRKLSLTGFVL